MNHRIHIYFIILFFIIAIFLCYYSAFLRLTVFTLLWQFYSASLFLQPWWKHFVQVFSLVTRRVSFVQLAQHLNTWLRATLFPLLAFTLVVISVFIFGHCENYWRQYTRRCDENKLITHVKNLFRVHSGEPYNELDAMNYEIYCVISRFIIINTLIVVELVIKIQCGNNEAI